MEFLNGFEQIFHVGWDRYLGICCAHKIFFSIFLCHVVKYELIY